MKIVYVTDLHGHKGKYEHILMLAIKHKATMVINGADMLPKGRDLHGLQRGFLKWLDKHFDKYDNAGIYYFGLLGNDDLRIWDKKFNDICNSKKYVKNIAQKCYNIEGFNIIGCNWVCDYPFRLKDRCRIDTHEYVFQEQFGPGLYSTPTGWEDIEDWQTECKKKPSLQKELNKLPKPKNKDRVIYVIHMPPIGMGLDVCAGYQYVGSKAVAKFVLDKQPYLSFHGHIHESPDMSSKWRCDVEPTTFIQPGQGGYAKLNWVLLDTDTNKFERFVDDV